MADIYPAEAWPSDAEISQLDGTTDQATGLPYIARGTGPTSDPPLEIQYNRAQQRLKKILAPWNQGRVVDEGNGKIGVFPLDYWLGGQIRHFSGATGQAITSDGSWAVYLDKDGVLQITETWPSSGEIYLPLAEVYLSNGSLSIVDCRPMAAFRICREPLMWPLVATLQFTIGGEVNDQTDVTVQVVDAEGQAVSDYFEVHLWLSDSQYGGETSSAPDGGVSVQTGTLLVEESAAKRWRVLSDANGQVVMRITHSGIATWYVNGQVGGKIVASGAVSFQ